MVSVKKRECGRIIRTKAVLCLNLPSVKYLENLSCLTLCPLFFFYPRRSLLFLSCFCWSEKHEGRIRSTNGGGGVLDFSPFWEGTAQKIPPWDIFDQPFCETSSIRSKLVDHVGTIQVEVSQRE